MAIEQSKYNDQDDLVDGKSKSQIKRDMITLQKLAVELAGLKKKQLAALPISQPLLRAIAEYNRLGRSFIAKKRQTQFMGKLMRDCDHEEITTILTRMKVTNSIPKPQVEPSTTAPAVKIHEHWCEVILSKGDSGINDLLSEFPRFERSKLRLLYREISKFDKKLAQLDVSDEEKLLEKRHKRKMKLLRYLRENLN